MEARDTSKAKERRCRAQERRVRGKSGEPKGGHPGGQQRWGYQQGGHKVIRLSMGVDRVDEEASHRRSGSSSRSGPQPESDED